jgi:hypothetical protein
MVSAPGSCFGVEQRQLAPTWQPFPVANAGDGERRDNRAPLERHRGGETVQHTGEVAGGEGIAGADRVTHGDRDSGGVTGLPVRLLCRQVLTLSSSVWRPGNRSR